MRAGHITVKMRAGHITAGKVRAGEGEDVAGEATRYLQPRVGINVEEGILDKIVFGETAASLSKEDLRDVSKQILATTRLQQWQHTRGRAARPRANLESD